MDSPNRRNERRRHFIARHLILILLIILTASVACQASGQQDATSAEALQPLALPELAPVQHAPDQRLQVVATTGIIGDVVGQVGGKRIELTTLMGPGEDPHSYEPSTGDLTRVAQADVILVNGWQLEEGLLDDLANVSGETPIVSISANITPLPYGRHADETEPEEDGEHSAADPHVWLDPQLVAQWVRNVDALFSSLDPANAGHYAANAAAYLEELAALDEYMAERLSEIPPARRKLVTNHDALAYFARRFDFEIVGAVIPAASTLAEPSAQELAGLVQRMREENVCTIFAESTASVRLAETVATELSGCDNVQVLSLYTDALGAPDSNVGSYLQLMRTNTDTIVQGLSH